MIYSFIGSQAFQYVNIKIYFMTYSLRYKSIVIMKLKM